MREIPQLFNRELAGVFDSGPEQANNYDRFRPPYPEEIFVGLEQEAELRPNARVLEIGAGPGQATVPLAQRGYDLTALEPSTGASAIARQKTRAYPNTEVLTSTLEGADLELGNFDAVFSAMALHWVAPDQRFSMPHALLKPGGRLAILYRSRVSDGGAGDRFFAATLPLLQQYNPNYLHVDDSFTLPNLNNLETEMPPPLDTGLFEPQTLVVANSSMSWSAPEYVGYLHTLSWFLGLPEADRGAFVQGVTDVIEQDFDGHIDTTFSTLLAIARKRESEVPRQERPAFTLARLVLPRVEQLAA